MVQKKYIYVFCLLLTLGATMFYWNPTQGYEKDINEDTYWNYPLNTTYFGETDVIWSAGPAKSYPISRIELIEGKAVISDFVKTNHTQNFTIQAESVSKIVSHTQYFPGWRVYVDNIKTPIEFQDQNWRGLITFQVPEGTHAIRIQFEETLVRTIGNIISLISLILVVAIGILSFRIHIKNKK